MSGQRKVEKSPSPSKRRSVAAKGATQSAGSARPRVRKIRHSPVANPNKVKLVRQIVRELKAKQSLKGTVQNAKSCPEVPFVTVAR